MADKKISDLTSVSTLADNDVFELETGTGGNSRQVTFANYKAAIGGPVLIQKQTPSGVATVTFSSIPSTYTHLMLVGFGRTSVAATTDTTTMRFNSDTGANYDLQQMQDSNTTINSIQSLGQTSITIMLPPGASATAGYGGASHLFIYNYADTNLNKLGKHEAGWQTSTASFGVNGRAAIFGWRSTSAITRIDINTTGNWVTGTVFSLYGLY